MDNGTSKRSPTKVAAEAAPAPSSAVSSKSVDKPVPPNDFLNKILTDIFLINADIKTNKINTAIDKILILIDYLIITSNINNLIDLFKNKTQTDYKSPSSGVFSKHNGVYNSHSIFLSFSDTIHRVDSELKAAQITKINNFYKKFLNGIRDTLLTKKDLITTTFIDINKLLTSINDKKIENKDVDSEINSIKTKLLKIKPNFLFIFFIKNLSDKISTILKEDTLTLLNTNLQFFNAIPAEINTLDKIKQFTSKIDNEIGKSHDDLVKEKTELEESKRITREKDEQDRIQIRKRMEINDVTSKFDKINTEISELKKHYEKIITSNDQKLGNGLDNFNELNRNIIEYNTNTINNNTVDANRNRTFIENRSPIILDDIKKLIVSINSQIQEINLAIFMEKINGERVLAQNLNTINEDDINTLNPIMEKANTHLETFNQIQGNLQRLINRINEINANIQTAENNTIIININKLLNNYNENIQKFNRDYADSINTPLDTFGNDFHNFVVSIRDGTVLDHIEDLTNYFRNKSILNEIQLKIHPLIDKINNLTVDNINSALLRAGTLGIAEPELTNIRNILNQYNERKTTLLANINRIPTQIDLISRDIGTFIQNNKPLIDTRIKEELTRNFDRELGEAQTYHNRLPDYNPNTIVNPTYPGDLYPTDVTLLNSYNHYIQNYINKNQINSVYNTKYAIAENHHPQYSPLDVKFVNYVNCGFKYIQDNLTFIHNIFNENGDSHNYYLIDGMNMINDYHFLDTFLPLLISIAVNITDVNDQNKSINALKQYILIRNDLTITGDDIMKKFFFSNKKIILVYLFPKLFEQISIKRDRATLNSYNYTGTHQVLTEFDLNFSGERHDGNKFILEPIYLPAPAAEIDNKNIFVMTYHGGNILPSKFQSNACSVYILSIPECDFDVNNSIAAVDYRVNKYNLFDKFILGGKTKKNKKNSRKTRKNSRKKQPLKKLFNKKIGGAIPVKNESDDHIIMYIYLYLSYQSNMINKVSMISRDRYAWITPFNDILDYDVSTYRRKINPYINRELNSDLLNKNNLEIFNSINYTKFIIDDNDAEPSIKLQPNFSHDIDVFIYTGFTQGILENLRMAVDISKM
ncbi:unannotated protein [freshwater metagenome]|uniref:Unannotated protein n=1 Tax=freshwater metagenome TaxID=449393 RepID=A0A6J6EDH1_9ZZZZ